MSEVITGSIENGRRRLADFPVYRGEVGVRERAGVMELAWFGRAPAFARSVEGTLDGLPARITAVQSQPLTSDGSLRQGGGTRAVIATAEWL